MGDIGRSMYDTLIESQKTQKGKCKCCGSSLELYELDVRRSQKILKCQRCGALHLYKKNIVGKWRLEKAQKIDMPPPR